MASTNCAACGADLLDLEARFCSTCGSPVPDSEPAPDADLADEPDGVVADNVPVAEDSDLETDVPAEHDSDPEDAGGTGGLSKFGLEVPSRLRPTDEHWQYATWGAVAAGVVAIVALLAVVFSLLTNSDETSRSPVAAASEPTTTTTVRSWIGVVTEFPVTDPSIVESPLVGDSAGYFHDRQYIAFRLTVDTCERSDGMLKASGSIRNETHIDQTLDYHIVVKMQRRVVGTSLASLETTVVRLGAGETAEWSVEAVSTKTVNVACDVATLTVSPSERS